MTWMWPRSRRRPATSSIQEVSRIAESFGTVQGAAVSAAVDQARLRKGINQVFLNISMRNQSLLHRQLGMLDSMERRTSEPGALADLFRLDHLTTRMRRHAEGLIILSGSVPGRGWRDPVPGVDILRAAVAEVEDYVRVDVASESDDLVAGNAVSDVIHLIAELIENATVFSPPNTRIEVRAERVGTGLVAEVEDRGLGLSPDELDDINARLASPAEFDLRTASSSGCSWSAGWRPGTTSRSRSAGPCTAAPRPWCCCRSAWWCGRKRPARRVTGTTSRPTRGPRPDRTAPDARHRVRARHERSGEHRRAGMAGGSVGDRAVERTAGRWSGRPGRRGRRGRSRRRHPGPGSPARDIPARDIRPERPAGAALAGAVTRSAAEAVTAGGAAAGRPAGAVRPEQPGGAIPAAGTLADSGRPVVTSGCRSGFRRPAWPRSCGPARRRPAGAAGPAGG